MAENLSESLAIAQYEALRSEIMQRVDLRQQVLTFTILVAGSFFSLGVQTWVSGITILCYPMIAMFLACAWTQHDEKIGQIIGYLKPFEDTHLGTYQPGWETHRQKAYRMPKKHGVSSSLVFPVRGVFLISQLIALVVGLARLVQEPPGSMQMVFSLFVLVDSAVTVYTYGVLRHRREWHERTAKQ